MRNLCFALLAGLLLAAMSPSAFAAGVSAPTANGSTDTCAQINNFFNSQPPRCVKADASEGGVVLYIIVGASAPGSAANSCASANGIGLVPHMAIWRESNPFAGLQVEPVMGPNGEIPPDTRILTPCGAWQAP